METNCCLAIATIPVQQWNTVYDCEEAMKVGTIFPELNLPFFAADSGECTCHKNDMAPAGKDQEQVEREGYMRQIQGVSFALDDLRLFLDTHPDQTNAVDLKQTLLQKRKELLADFAQKFYPLTQDCEGCWGKGPMPWEGACV